ncbi:class I glutamine amidotransferase-like protein, partial [Mycena olivaceomarginata]
VNPTTTYAAALASGEQYDIIWVPAGGFARVLFTYLPFQRVPEGLIPFISTQAPKAKYILSVCSGAGYLAFAGLLSGKRATTNKVFYRGIAATPKAIQWVPKARWVVDGWVQSPVFCCSDMALAFVEYLAGPRAARFLRSTVEVRKRHGGG